MSYVCTELQTDLLGRTNCKTWEELQETEPLSQTLAISASDAGLLGLAIVSSLFMGWLFREIGRMMLQLSK